MPRGFGELAVDSATGAHFASSHSRSDSSLVRASRSWAKSASVLFRTRGVGAALPPGQVADGQFGGIDLGVDVLPPLLG